MSLLILIPLAILVGLLGCRRRLGFWGGFLASFVLLPIGALLLVWLSGKRRPSG